MGLRLNMEPLPTAGATVADLALVQALIRKGDLLVDIGGAWVSPNAELVSRKVLLVAYSPDAIEESE